MPNTLSHRQSIISQYIQAKDANKPFLMQKAFVDSALLEMKVNTEAITFPTKTTGVDGITQILVRGFSEQYENVYTVCLADSVTEQKTILSCQWLVGMAERKTGNIKVGCGVYDWSFENREKPKVESLMITIACMDIIDRQHSDVVFDWLSALPYPWVERTVLLSDMPVIDKLIPIKNYLDTQE